jgi:N-methylhydantoinase B
MVVDLSACGDQALGPINSGALMAVSAVRYAFKRLINPQQPVNGGSFAPLEVSLREGSFVAAREPASCYYYSALGLVVDLIPKALSRAVPDLVAAAHYGDSCTTAWSGTDPRNGQFFLDIQGHAGGWGACRGGDGESALICASVVEVRDEPIKVVETKTPIKVRRYGFRPDSAGAGRWRGGHGLIREYEVGADTSLTAWFERSKTTAWGLEGGCRGQGQR